jgi:hypothetical protein
MVDATKLAAPTAMMVGKAIKATRLNKRFIGVPLDLRRLSQKQYDAIHS